MSRSELTPAIAAIHLVVGVVLLSLFLRCWFVLGLLDPVTVSGSSMAPSLCGQHVTASCKQCGKQISAGVEFAQHTQEVCCPGCNRAVLSLADLPVQFGTRIWIDRTTFQRRKPHRWELVVFRSPYDGGQLAVKRVVGLPGETLSLREGNVYVNDAVLVKTLAEQRLLRHLVHRETGRNMRWRPQKSDTWKWKNEAWFHPSDDSRAKAQFSSGAQWNWLEYVHPHPMITDQHDYNVGVTQRLQIVQELFLSSHVSIDGTGTFAVKYENGQDSWQFALDLTAGMVRLSQAGADFLQKPLPEGLLSQLRKKVFLLEVSTFDGQLLLALDEIVVLRYALPASLESECSRTPWAVGGNGLGLKLTDTTLYRDKYYAEVHAAGVPSKVPLGQNQYYFLGDNVPVSLDSRQWGPLPERFLVGKPRLGR